MVESTATFFKKGSDKINSLVKIYALGGFQTEDR